MINHCKPCSQCQTEYISSFTKERASLGGKKAWATNRKRMLEVSKMGGESRKKKQNYET